jgi:SNF2 family DNA or RNA helicase
MKLRKIQKQGFLYCQDVEHPALFIDMRGGKTILSMFDVMFSETLPCLICVPLTTIFGWEQDLQKLGVPKSEYTVIIGTKDNKLSLINADLMGKSFILTNKEFFLSVPELAFMIDFKAVILDESTCIKNPSAKITKFYIENFRSVDRRYILTGTPAPKNELNYFGQLQFLDPTILKCKNYNEFKFTKFYSPFQGCYKLKPDLKAQFYKILDKRCFFRSIKEIRAVEGLEDLKTERIVRSFPLNPKIKKTYDKLKDLFLMTLDDKILFGIEYVLQQMMYLRKLCSGFATIDLETKETKFVDDSKYLLLEDLLKNELSKHKIIIICNFYDEIYKIEKVLQHLKKKFRIITGKTKNELRGTYIHEFQTTDLQIMLANKDCLKYGVTLSKADITIEFSTMFGEARDQAEMRGTDIYINDSRCILHLIAEKTIEEFFYKTLNREIKDKQLIDELRIFLRDN